MIRRAVVDREGSRRAVILPDAAVQVKLDVTGQSGGDFANGQITIDVATRAAGRVLAVTGDQQQAIATADKLMAENPFANQKMIRLRSKSFDRLSAILLIVLLLIVKTLRCD